ncbi:TonB-dependent hemoglobin/transferrin/lactoferrin family receptor [Campylobacter sp. MOP7]|uniref:TonB-dependent hemoglobin/transferrin/lactoferrin family receptor n=1 Tax=Campylobacter canis TaxID=3378588 RepID=UPI00387E38EF
MGKLKFSLVALAILGMGLNLQGEDKNVDQVELGGVTITDSPEDDPLQKKVGEIKKSSKTLTKEQVSDTRDLVRYETSVSAVEKGRFGASGYSIRGVDENRVAITVDGLRQAETISSQGFKELFEGYGNFNNTRNGVEIENLKQATISKGADSVKVGSGSLGGSVMFETKDARDFLIEKDWFYGFKGGYSTENNQFMQSHTLAARLKMFDILFIKTKRNGKEFENYGYKGYDGLRLGKEREKSDPYKISKNSTLLKLSFNPNETNRISLMYDNSKTSSIGEDLSYNLIAEYEKDDKKAIRHTNDKTSRKNVSFGYENFDETPIWDTFKINFSNQKIQTRARNDDYCVGDKCTDISNPSGIHFNKEGHLVDKNGVKVAKKQKNSDSQPDLVDAHGNILATGKQFKEYRGNEVYINCKFYDCSKGLSVLKRSYSNPVIEHVELIPYTENKNYAQIKNPSSYYVALPNQPGHLTNLWKERDLNTDTKQLDFEASKSFETKSIEHTLTYGGLYSHSQKNMVNKTGTNYKNHQWWNKMFAGLSIKGPTPVFDECTMASGGDKCPITMPEESFLIPVKTKNGSFYIGDEIQVNNYVSFDFTYRFDKIKHRPNYIPGSTPKIPNDMVKGIFVPLKTLPPAVSEYDRPTKNWRYGSTNYATGEFTFDPGKEEQFNKDLAEFEKKFKVYKDAKHYNDVINPQENIAHIARPKEFREHTYSLAATIDPLDYFRMQFKYAKGFRAPTSDEIYFTFKHPDFTVLPNLGLEQEIAKTKEVAFTLHNSPSFVRLNLFESRYKNFLDLEFIGRANFDNAGNLAIKEENGKIKILPGGRGKQFSIWQNVNKSQALVRGFEIESKLFLDQIYKPLHGFSAGIKYSYQKGRVQDDEGKMVPMNAIQPHTAIYTLGYISPNEKFGADLYISRVSAKKKTETYNMFWKEEGKKDSYLKWRSNGYTTIDMIAFYSPIKNLTLRFGAHNITNEKYLTWESARSIRPFGTSNLINQDTGKGINRFYAPGRNFKFTFEFTF